MDRSLYVAMSGASQAWDAQTAISHNIANSATVGFKATLVEAASRQVNGPGLASRVHSVSQSPGFDSSGGHLMHTDRSLDIALGDDLWLGVLGQDGELAYTRAGDLQLNALGQLTTASGLAVSGEGGAIALPPFEAMEIGADGTISIVPQGGGANQLVVLDRLNVARFEAGSLERGADGLFRPAQGVEAQAEPGQVLISGALESSNVNLAQSLVQMIEQQRRFEFQIKAMQTADENAQRSAELMKLA